MLIEPFFYLLSLFYYFFCPLTQWQCQFIGKNGGFLKKPKYYRFDKITQYPGLKNALN
jgi:hypothetical protein